MSDFTVCSTCETERETATLNPNGQCPFCVDAEVPAPVPAPPEDTGPLYPEIIVQPSKVVAAMTAGRAAAKAEAAVPKVPRALKPENQKDVDEAFALPYSTPNFNLAEAAANPAKELAMRALCRRKFLPFVQRYRPKYMAGWVHMDICRRLERFMQQVELGMSPRLLLMMPPRSGKSELGSRHFPPWVLGQHPDWEIIAASHTSSLTLSFSRYIRDLTRDPSFQALFPDMRLDPTSQSVENWNTLSGGGYMAAGVGTGITGRGAHILLLDDLVKDIEAADSSTIRENTWEWYGSTAYTRLAPGGGVLGIMTWWNEDDWAGKIQQVMASGEGDVFEVIRYPAINDEGDEYLLRDDSIVQYPEASKIPEGATLTRPKGTAIHPARYDTAAMLRIKGNLCASGQKRIWQALYQQNPTPDDGIYFSKDMLRWYIHEPQRQNMFIYQAWDFAITEEQQNDYTVCCTIGQDEFDNLYVLHVFRFRSDDGNAIVEHMIDQSIAFGADLLGFEDGQIWKSLKAQYEKRCLERMHYTTYEILQPLTNKMVRANPLKGRMQLGKVFVKKNAAWAEVFVRELMTFPAGKHDDQVDAAAWAVRLTLTRSAPRRAVPKPLPSWRDKLGKINEGDTSAMSA
jgi:predicted phage terminase large subunit-like protein